jgi:hypothetical protein
VFESILFRVIHKIFLINISMAQTQVSLRNNLTQSFIEPGANAEILVKYDLALKTKLIAKTKKFND